MRLGMQIWMRCSGSDWHEDTQKHPGVVQAVQQALTDKELELAAVSSAGAAESGAQSASYLQKEIAVLKCRNERLGHESCRLRDKLQTQARGFLPYMAAQNAELVKRQHGCRAILLAATWSDRPPC